MSGALAGRTVTAVIAGALHTCAVADGRAFCWSANDAGQLGNNSLVNALTPVAVRTSGGTVTAISAGFYHSCAVTDRRAY